MNAEIATVRDGVSKLEGQVLFSLRDEDVEVYLFLMDRYESNRGRVSNDHVFQFLFRSYYRLDNAGLSDDFKRAYFERMEELFGAQIDLREICLYLTKFRNRRNQISLQFSFATKMAATIDSSLPIFDSFVAKMLDFRPPGYGRSLEQRLERYLDFYNNLKEVVRLLSKDERIKSLRDALAQKLAKWTSLSIEKQIDFILWAAGKAL